MRACAAPPCAWASRSSRRTITALTEAIAALAKTERDGEVAKQLVLSIGYASDATRVPVIDSVVERYLAHEGVFLAACTVLWKKPSPFLLSIKSGEALAKIKDPARARPRHRAVDERLRAMGARPRAAQGHAAGAEKLITGGEAVFYQICASCHGGDGKGVKIPGTENLLAPSLAGSARVKGPPDGLVPVLINGLLGPIEGKTYEGQMMVPATALGITRDDRLAEVLSFVRYAWGNGAGSDHRGRSEEIPQAARETRRRRGVMRN